MFVAKPRSFLDKSAKCGNLCARNKKLHENDNRILCLDIYGRSQDDCSNITDESTISNYIIHDLVFTPGRADDHGCTWVFFWEKCTHETTLNVIICSTRDNVSWGCPRTALLILKKNLSCITARQINEKKQRRVQQLQEHFVGLCAPQADRRHDLLQTGTPSALEAWLLSLSPRSFVFYAVEIASTRCES